MTEQANVGRGAGEGPAGAGGVVAREELHRAVAQRQRLKDEKRALEAKLAGAEAALAALGPGRGDDPAELSRRLGEEMRDRLIMAAGAPRAFNATQLPELLRHRVAARRRDDGAFEFECRDAGGAPAVDKHGNRLTIQELVDGFLAEPGSANLLRPAEAGAGGARAELPAAARVTRAELSALAPAERAAVVRQMTSAQLARTGVGDTPGYL